MKYGIYYAYWEDKWEADYFKYIEKVAKLGFDFLEIACTPINGYDRQKLADLRKCAADNGIFLTAGHGPNVNQNLASADPAIQKSAKEFFTTLLNLIMRFYDVTEGSVFVDGRDVRDYNLWALRDKMGYVPQKSFLFAGTIGSNIDYGHRSGLENTLSEIKRAAEVGQSKEFIEQKSGAYDAEVDEGGSNFSGGQRQRLTISRAICRDPETYLFDDSFSALDFKTDATLRKNLRESAEDATQVIVGQRIGSIMNADTILVIDEGRIVGMGKHEELLKTCDVYREIAYSQLVPEEVA